MTKTRIALLTAAVIAVAAGGTAYAARPSDDDRAAEECRTEVRHKWPDAVFAGDPFVTDLDGVDSTTFKVYGRVRAADTGGDVRERDYRCELRVTDGRWSPVAVSVWFE